MALAGIWAIGEYPLHAFVNLEQMAYYTGFSIRSALVCARSGVSRAAYATVGLVGVAIKHNLDRLIASSFPGYKNSFNYWAPPGKAAGLDHLQAAHS